MKKKLSIMLIDDSEIDLYLHEKFLKIKEIAHHTTTFNNADEALSYLIDDDKSVFPDVILLDIQMPSFDGFDFQLKRIGREPYARGKKRERRKR